LDIVPDTELKFDMLESYVFYKCFVQFRMQHMDFKSASNLAPHTRIIVSIGLYRTKPHFFISDHRLEIGQDAWIIFDMLELYVFYR
jgi:hypothetical protein